MLSYAEIKAIASGNPLVMEKVRIDTEVRRLDLLRAAHINQQFEIGRKVRDLPGQIAHAKAYHVSLLADITRRDRHETKAPAITIAGRVYTGDTSRKQAGEALNKAARDVLWEKDRELRQAGSYKGFAIMVERSGTLLLLYVRGENTYEARLNTENPLGTILSIESVLRSLNRHAQEEQEDIARKEKALADYQAQLGRSFEQEAQLRELLAKQQEMNKQLDLDKHETQVVAEGEHADKIAD